MPKRKHKTNHTVQTRNRNILETAANVFHNRGYDNAAISEIARAVHLTKAGLYHHIYSKERLLFDIMNYGMDLTQEYVADAIKDIKDPLQKLKRLIENHLRLILLGRKREVTVILHENKTLKGALRSRINEKKKNYIHLVQRILRDVAKKYGIRHVDIRSATFCLLGMINWCYQWYKPGRTLSLKRVTNDFTTIFLHGVLANKRKT